ncbi:MAG: hypothetical protein ACP5KL_05980 [Thermoplasmata archaeon]|jgi:archaellum biogenesis ATPase FlaH/exonuclease VII small subunit
MDDTCTFVFGDRRYTGRFLGIDEGFVFVNVGGRHIAFNVEYLSEFEMNGRVFFFFFTDDRGNVLTPVNIDSAVKRLVEAVPSKPMVDVVTVEKMKTELITQLTVEKERELSQKQAEIESLKAEVSRLKAEVEDLRQDLALYESGEKLAPAVEGKIRAYEERMNRILTKLKDFAESRQDTPLPKAPADPEFKELLKKVVNVLSSPRPNYRRPVGTGVVQGRTTTGLIQFDKLLNGGLTYGNSVLVSFETFTGGELLSLHLLMGGIDSGERVVLLLNGISELNFWLMSRRTGLGLTNEHIFNLKTAGRLTVAEVKDVGDLQMEIDEFIHSGEDKGRMIVYTIDSFIEGSVYLNFIAQFGYLKYALEGKNRNIFLFMTSYPDREDVTQRVMGITKGVIQFRKQEYEDKVVLKMKIQGLTNDVQKWLDYQLSEDGSFEIQSPNVRKI